MPVIISYELQKAFECSGKWTDVARRARELFAAEAAPINRMTVEQIEAVMNVSEFVMMRLEQRVLCTADAADIAHRLAQPVPAEDPDKEAKALAWDLMQVGRKCFPFTSGDNPDELWAKTPHDLREWFRGQVVAKARRGR